MEILLGTFGHVYSAIRVHSDLKEELDILQDNIENAESVLKPISTPEERSSLPAETVDLFLKLSQAIEQAKESAKRIADSQLRRSRWAIPATVSNIFSLRPTKDVEELKALSEKIKSLASFLSTSLLHARTLSLASNKQRSSRGRRSSIVESPGPRDSSRSTSAKSSLADTVISNVEARMFWSKHFGAEQYDVSWRRFIDAVRHEFFPAHRNSGRTVRRQSQFFDYLRDRLDALGDSEVTIYAWAQFVASSDQTSVEAALKDLMQEAEGNDFKPPMLRGSTLLPVPIAPPSTTPEKSRILMRATTEIFPATLPDPFELELYGDPAIISLPAVKSLHIIRPPSPALRIELGRALFQSLPSKYLAHISRLHCTIEPLRTGSFASSMSSSLSSISTMPAFQIIDSSGNGTYLNGKRLQKGVPVPLNDGDKITILSHRKGTIKAEETILGFTFKDLRGSRLQSFQSNISSRSPRRTATKLLLPQSGSATLPLPALPDSIEPSSPTQSASNSRAFLSQAQSIRFSSSELDSPSAEEEPSTRGAPALRSSKKRKSSIQEIETSLLEVPRPKRTKLVE